MLTRRHFIKLGAALSLVPQHVIAANKEKQIQFIPLLKKAELLQNQIMNDNQIHNFADERIINKLIYEFKTNDPKEVLKKIQRITIDEYTNGKIVLINGLVFTPIEITACLVSLQLLEEKNVIL